MARSKTDLTLTVAARLEDADRVARELHREIEQSTGAVGDKVGAVLGAKFAQGIANQEPRIARSIEKSVVHLSRANEMVARQEKNQEQVLNVTEQLEDVNRRLNRAKESGVATERELNDLIELRVSLMTQLNRLEQSSITLSSQRNRAFENYSAALRGVIKAQDDVNSEGGGGQTLLSLGKMISALRSVAIPFTGTAVATMGAQMLQVASAATQSLWMIPAAAGAAAAGIGTVSLATVGFGDAMKDIGDPEKFAEALQNLSPNAQQAALAIEAIMEPLKQLKDATQDAFFAGGAEMITTLTNQYLPMVEQLTTGIAGAFNQAGRGIFDMLMTPQTQQVIKELFDNLVSAFERLAPAAAPFSQAILDIVNAGSGFLPEIASAAARAAESFATFISKASESGDLERWMREGLNTISGLWQAVKDLGKAFADLAPAGREHLPEIVNAIEKLSTTIPPLINLVGDLADPFFQVMDAAKPLESNLVPSFKNIENAIKPVTEQVWLLKKALETVKQFAEQFSNFIKRGPILGLFGLGKDIINGATPQTTVFTDPSQIPAGATIINGPAKSASASGGPASAPSAPSTKAPGVADPTGGLLSSIFGTTAQVTDTAGIAPPPAGGYPLPAPPPPKGSGGGSGKADEPPFTADPSTYSLDSIPIGGFFGDAGASGAVPAPMAAVPTGPIVVPDMTRAQAHIDAIAAMGQAFNLSNTSDVRYEPKSFHHTGNAVDLSNSSGPTPEMHAFAMYMAQNFGQFIQELIYSDPVRGDVLIGDGRVVGPGTDQPNYYDAATRAQHMNHVHIAVKEAMAPYLAAAMQSNMFAGAAGGGYMSVDQQAVAKAQTDLEQAYRTVEEKRLAYLKLQQSGDADQLQLLRAKNDVIQAEENYREREAALAQARMGKYRELDDGLTSAAARVTDSMGQIGAALADDFGLSEGLPGVAKWLTTFLANLAFAPAIGQMSAISAMSPIKGGHGMFGMMGAQNIAAGRSPLGLSGGGFAPVAPAMGVGMTTIPGVGTGPLPGPAPYTTPAATTTTGLGFTPTGATPGAAAIGPAPLGGGVGAPMTGVPGTAGQGFFNSQAAASYLDQNAAAGTPQTSRAPTAGTGGGFGGLGDIPMAAIGGAISAGSLALDAFAPGAGAIAGQAAQTGIQVANRTAAYIGQLGGILAGGLLETFIPNSSEAGDPSKSWLGRIASGIAGARPALPNTAGSPAPAQQPQQAQQGQQQYGPMVKIDNLINNTPDSGQTLGRTLARQGMVANARGQR